MAIRMKVETDKGISVVLSVENIYILENKKMNVAIFYE